MPYLMFELNVSDERRAQHEEFLRLNSLGIQKSSEHLLRALQLMAPQDDAFTHGVVFALARHVAEEVDAISILVGKGCIEPCKAHLRSAFEAELGILYIFECDSERRAIAYHVKEARERLRSNEKYDARTEVGIRVRDAMMSDPIGVDVLNSLPEYDFDSENESIRQMLSAPPYAEINAEYDAKPKNKAWHALFGGPRTIRDLAYHLGRPFWYEFLYADWSGRLHAGNALRNVASNSKEPERKGKAIRPIRHPDGLRDMYNFGLGISSGVATLLGKHYLTDIGRNDLRRLYLEEVKPLNDQLKDVQITADWH